MKDAPKLPGQRMELGLNAIEPKAIAPAKRGARTRTRGDAEDRQSQKMAALGALAAGIAHEFNNLLMTISTHVVLARGPVAGRARPSGSAMKKHFEGIDQAVEQAREMTRSLLIVARKEQPDRQLVDLGNLVEEAASMFRRLLPASIRLKLTPVAQRWQTEANPDQLRQVLLNLVVNARDAMPDGGELHLAVAAAKGRSRPRGARRWVTIIVEDTGCGMPDAVVRRAFEPFYTTKPRAHGTGIGLAIVAGIIDAHGGRVLCQSTPGTGTRFEVWLPTQARKSPARGEIGKSSRASKRAST